MKYNLNFRTRRINRKNRHDLWPPLRSATKPDNETVVLSSFPLDNFIGNVDDQLKWGARGFSHAAEDVNVINGDLLVAKLKNQAGELVDSTLDLDQYIQNINGVLEAIPLVVSPLYLVVIDPREGNLTYPHSLAPHGEVPYLARNFTALRVLLSS
ncbi:hypothetical protein CPB84DRAFT_1748162 [Gymnopilus junonius]|uniref:Cyanovirin-N domain-containing protein n=1 Tax=Gymnopilus junonius TaxID=109634 RepID=A0A9P5NMK2_GYMJU|nr:hypothetical protein CPB84DRAFT_1748162 [Gymnopilus junonius]